MTQKIISRFTLNKNIKIKSLRIDNEDILEKNVDYFELIEIIDKCKTFLLYSKQVKPGQKVILANFFWPEYLGWFYACTELGLSFVISDYPKTDASLKKLEIYDEIDWIIYDHHCPPGFKKWSNKIIPHDEIKNIEILPTPILANPEDVILYATTSGTTGSPKVVKYTHAFFFDLLHRNARIYNLKNTDRCFHSKNLHHGSVMGVYFLPTLFYSENHYHAPFKYVELDVDQSVEDAEGDLFKSWVEMIQKEKINKVLLFFNQLDVFTKYLKIENKIHDDLTVFVLSKIKKEDIEIIVENFNYKIYSIFGCTETSGPLFLPEITKDSDPKNMKNILDDFYDITLENNKLIVGMPNGSKIATGDKFEIINGEWIFNGRDNLYRINGHPVYLELLNETLEKITNLKKEIDFDVVIDNDYNQIYLRSNKEIDLSKLNNEIYKELGLNHYFVNYNLVDAREHYFSGIKFDPESIRYICRQRS